MYLTCKEDNNARAHYEALYALLALISIELANEEVVVDLIRLVLAMQVGRCWAMRRMPDLGQVGTLVSCPC